MTTEAGAGGEPGPAAEVSQGVLLDIGGDMGALVIYATEALLGREVEVSPAGAATQRVHAVVHQRCADARQIFAAVFPALAQDGYLLRDGERTLGRVEITGGQVTEVAWPARGSPAMTPAPGCPAAGPPGPAAGHDTNAPGKAGA